MQQLEPVAGLIVAPGDSALCIGTAKTNAKMQTTTMITIFLFRIFNPTERPRLILKHNGPQALREEGPGTVRNSVIQARSARSGPSGIRRESAANPPHKAHDGVCPR